MGADTTIGMDQFYGRNMRRLRGSGQDFVRLGQLYARHAEVTSVEGERYEAGAGRRWTWSSGPLASPARGPGSGWRRDLGVRVRGRTVGGMVEAAASAGAPCAGSLAPWLSRPWPGSLRPLAG